MGRFRDGFRGYPARGCAPNVNYPRTLAVPTDARLLTETVRRARTNLPHCADGARKAGVFSKFENELRCFSNGIGVKHSKESAQCAYRGIFRGEFHSYPARHACGCTPNVKYPRAACPRCADDAHLRFRKPCVGRCCFMFLPGLLGSPMRAARGMTAMTQLLPAEGHCRRFAFDSRAPTADFTSRLSANVPLTRARFSLSSAVLLLPLPIPIVRSPPASCTAFVIAAALPVIRKAKILLSRKKKAVRRFLRAAFHIRFTASGRFRIPEGKIMRCDSDSGKKLIKSMVLRTADRQGMC